MTFIFWGKTLLVCTQRYTEAGLCQLHKAVHSSPDGLEPVTLHTAHLLSTFITCFAQNEPALPSCYQLHFIPLFRFASLHGQQPLTLCLKTRLLAQLAIFTITPVFFSLNPPPPLLSATWNILDVTAKIQQHQALFSPFHPPYPLKSYKRIPGRPSVSKVPTNGGTKNRKSDAFLSLFPLLPQA